MSDIIGFAYFVLGGLVTGRVLHAMWQRDVFKVEDGEDYPLVGFLLMAILFWLAWPIVWGIHRAMRAAPRPTPTDTGGR